LKNLKIRLLLITKNNVETLRNSCQSFVSLRSKIAYLGSAMPNGTATQL